ncbi:hypothetical protein C7S18_06245 [Ahniella affigens]|uniref:Uncharacterized protein n=1 Tax=Ahniella affigens TaxID=2021234 RepID=A0A2P1PPQ8_9GAMM|nr:hypothetical protein [Ahniella affigens]AVP96826.1 hypothetical protein C7S18_06245 [Ahniella affigens]
MLTKILAALGIGIATVPATAAGLYTPYAEPHVNFLYNLLFCDDIALFQSSEAQKSDGVWSVLLADEVDTAALRKIADDQANEGRIRALAYNKLRANGVQVPKKELFGVIVEVPLEDGLDVLAAFSGGGVRYLNQSGKVSIFEGQGNPVEGLANELLTAAQPVVNAIGPWDKERLPPPKAGNVRITFLVSDGLYFGEGPFGVLENDSMAGPVLAKASQLLQETVELSVR